MLESTSTSKSLSNVYNYFNESGALIGVVDMVGFVRATEYNKLIPKE